MKFVSHFNKKEIIVFLILAVIAGISICKIVSLVNDYNKAAKLQEATVAEFVSKKADESTNEDITKEEDIQKTLVEQVTSVEEDDPNGWYHQIDVDINGLQSLNQDVVGWIYFENEESISYPLLYSGDNEEYLRKTYTGEERSEGSIFVEGFNNPDFSDAHTLIYGHNMKNLTMFGKLKFFKTDPDYYADHQYFQIITNDKVYRYKVFAYEDNSQPIGGVYSVYSKPLEDFYSFLEDTIIRRSQVSCDINIRDYDHVVTLSTCSTAGSDYRFSVSAVRVGEHNRTPGNSF